MPLPDDSARKAWLRQLAAPLVFLTVALLGGLRVSFSEHAFVFVPPPLISLLFAVLLVALLIRSRLIELENWLANRYDAAENCAHGLSLLTIFFGSAQVFNVVLPEAGLAYWIFSFFFLWTLWNNQFASFDARSLVKSLAVLFGTAFLFRYILLGGMHAPEGGWINRLTGNALAGAALIGWQERSYASTTGYVAFFAVLFYFGGLCILLAVRLERRADPVAFLLEVYRSLSWQQRERVAAALAETGKTSDPPLKALEALGKETHPE